MIPPKLAKMMINLAGKSKDDLILDPFCGSGTILQELVLLGYKNIIGSDVEDKAVSDSQENIDWFLEKYQLDKKIFNIKIFKSDVRALSSKISYKSVGGIITEPFLGSPKIKSYDLGKIKREIQVLEQLYLAGFKEFKKILKDSGVIVIIFPVYRFKNQYSVIYFRPGQSVSRKIFVFENIP